MSSPSYVTLVLDLYDLQGRPVTAGQALLTASSALTDPAGGQVIAPAPVPVAFTPPGLPAVSVLASDSPGPQPAGWAWTVTPNVAGALAPWSFYAPAGPVAFTATGASPAVFTWAAGAQAWDVRSLPDGTGVQLSGASLPGGFAEGAVYYVLSSSGDTVQLAAYQGGPPLASLSAGSGELAVVQWRLSALAPVQATAPMASYLPAPSGTPAAGYVPVAQAGGSPATAWGDPFVGRAGDVMAGPLSPAVTALTDAAAVAVDAAAGNDFTLQLTSAVGSTREIGAPAAPGDGQNVSFLLVQPAGGGPCTVTWAAGAGGYDFGSVPPPLLSTAPGAADLAAFKFSALLGRWLYLGSAGGF